MPNRARLPDTGDALYPLVHGAILKKLLELEEQTGFEIVGEEELKFIDACWERDGDITRRLLVELYYSVKKKRLPWDKYRIPLFDDEQIAQIGALCEKYNIDFELASRLLVSIERNKHKTRGSKAAKEFDRILSQEWVSYEEVAAEKERMENPF